MDRISNVKAFARALAYLGATAVAAASPASASQITYSEQVTASGSLDGMPFTDADVVLSMNNDTNNVTSMAGGYFFNFGTETVSVPGIGRDTFNNPGGVFDYHNYGISDVAGFQNPELGPTILDDYNAAFAEYNLATEFGPISGLAGINAGMSFPTVGGNLVLDDTSGSAIFSAAGDLEHLPGGPPTHPTPLPEFELIGSVSDTISAPFLGDFYEFRWPGNTIFEAIASVTGASSDAVYTVRLNCVTLVGALCTEPPPFYDWTLDASDGFMANIDFTDFYTGTWEIGIFGGSPADPEFTIDFVTPVEGVPVEGVPEPAPIAVLAAGFFGLTWLRLRRI